MKSIVNKIIFIVLLLIILFSINTEVHAWSQVIKDGKDFISTGESSGEGKINEGALPELSGYLYNILLSAGVVVAVIVATVLGIQFMIGGAEGQAKVKEMIVPFIVGCIIVFGGFGLWKVAITIGNSIENPTQYDFSEKECGSCRKKVTPIFDIDKRAYVCPSCGYIMQ